MEQRIREVLQAKIAMGAGDENDYGEYNDYDGGYRRKIKATRRRRGGQDDCGGNGTKAGAKKNDWIKFLKKKTNSKLSMAQKLKKYHAEQKKVKKVKKVKKGGNIGGYGKVKGEAEKAFNKYLKERQAKNPKLTVAQVKIAFKKLSLAKKYELAGRKTIAKKAPKVNKYIAFLRKYKNSGLTFAEKLEQYYIENPQTVIPELPLTTVQQPLSTIKRLNNQIKYDENKRKRIEREHQKLLQQQQKQVIDPFLQEQMEMADDSIIRRGQGYGGYGKIIGEAQRAFNIYYRRRRKVNPNITKVQARHAFSKLKIATKRKLLGK